MKKRILVLGNCVANRLQDMLACCPAVARDHELVLAPMIHLVHAPAQWEALAAKALSCDCILTQPLFNFGPCNTNALREKLAPEQRLVVFPSPNFEAYFPDITHLKRPEHPQFPPILDWDSSIIFSCFVKGISVFDVPHIYHSHALFKANLVMDGIADTLQKYAERERGLDIQTLPHLLKNYARHKLFHSPKHPSEQLMEILWDAVAHSLGLAPHVKQPTVPGFDFNQWPVVTWQHKLFHFPAQEYFVIGGRQTSMEDTAMAYYNFYEFHPEMVEWNTDKVIDI